MNWKPGDVALTVNCRHGINENKECAILSNYGAIGMCLDTRMSYQGWLIQAADGVTYCAKAKHLKPLPPPNEVTSWEDCIFQPTELVSR